MYVLSMLCGIAALIWGADRMVAGSAVIARNLGVAPMIIGLAVLGFLTSAPEILVSATAALSGVPELAIGNAIGSNIANIGLVAAGVSLFRPLGIRSTALRRELAAMTVITCVPVVLYVDENISRIDGALLLLAMTGFLLWVIRLGIQTRGRDAIEAQYAAEIPGDMRQLDASLRVLVGLVALIGGANLLVWASKNLALALGISELIIGITIVAIGTSLPELAVSAVAARKGEHGLALGNIIGSNAFNMLAVIGVATVLEPVALAREVLVLHLPAMVGMTVAFFFLTYNEAGAIRVGRPAAALLLAGFASYHGYVAFGTL